MMVVILSILTSAADTPAAAEIDFFKRSCMSLLKDVLVIDRDTAIFTTCVAVVVAAARQRSNVEKLSTR
jgi:hypothetical protein